MNASDVASNATINVTVTNSLREGASASVPFKVGTGGSVRLKAALLASGAHFPQAFPLSAAGTLRTDKSRLKPSVPTAVRRVFIRLRPTWLPKDPRAVFCA